MSKTAVFQYKCRLCGETYDDAHTSGDIAKYLLLSVVHGYEMPSGIIGMTPTLISTHPGCDMGYGVSDLIGYIVKE